MNKQKIINSIIIAIAVVSLSAGGYFYYKLNTLTKDANSRAKEEVQSLLSKVSKLYYVPSGEEPTIATVSDPDALKNQSFFSQAQKGDKVLIFTNAGKAVLYRPSINKIIEISPINNSKPTASKTVDTATTVPTTPVKKN